MSGNSDQRCTQCEEFILTNELGEFCGPDGEMVCEGCFDDLRTDYGALSCSCHIVTPCAVCCPEWHPNEKKPSTAHGTKEQG